MPNANKAVVIKVDDRFFSKYENNRVSTAWSLAGAQLFGGWEQDRIDKIVNILVKKKHMPVLMKIVVEK